MIRERVNLPSGRIGIVPNEKQKLSGNDKKLIREINDIVEKKKTERINNKKKIKKIKIAAFLAFLVICALALYLYFNQYL